jgi:penicillin-binding protein 1A
MASTLLLWAFGFMAACGVIVALLVGVALAMAYPQLPDVTALSDYRP